MELKHPMNAPEPKPNKKHLKWFQEIMEHQAKCECLIYAARGRDLPCYFCANNASENRRRD